MLEISGTISAISSVTAQATLAKCVSGTISATSEVTGASTLSKCVSGNVAAVSSVSGTGSIFKCASGTIAAQATVHGTIVIGEPVSTPTELSNIRNNLSKKYVLLDDIDLTSITNWEPIGTQATPFTGRLNGNGKTISNLIINRSTTNYIGLFGYCQFNNSADLPNLFDITITAANVIGQDYDGILAGYVKTTLGATGNALSDPAIGTLVNEISVAGTVSGRNYVGGAIGMTEGPELAGVPQSRGGLNYYVYADWIARLSDLASSVNVIGTGENISGLVGKLLEISLFKSNTTGTVTGGDIVGGIVGYGYRCGIFDSYSTGAISGIKKVGGIVGMAKYRPKIENCHSEGNITGTGGTYPGLVDAFAAGVGGIVGCTDADIINECFSLGVISAVYRAGGLVGAYLGGNFSSPNLFGSYARGNVSASSKHAGGLIGFLWASAFEFDQCYCIGSVTGTGAGAIIGVRGSYIEWEDYELVDANYDQPAGDVYFLSEVFYNSDANTASSQYGGTGATAAQLQLQATYEDASDPWRSFDSTWVIDDEDGDLYPQLKSMVEPYGLAINLIRAAQGLTFSYLKAGELFNKQLSSGTWSADAQITEVTAAESINTFRTSDNRLGFVVLEGESVKWLLTDPNAMTIASQMTLAKGLYGDVVQTPDNEAVVLSINEVSSLVQMKADVSGGWSNIAFGAAKPLPSDSQISAFRAGIFGVYGYLVWRSRGQHRLMVVSLAKETVEKHRVRNGTITMSLDSPIVSMSVEFDEEVVI